MTDADPGYHRDPSKMTHHYDLELVWCTESETRTVCPLGRVDHMNDTKHMLCDTFPQFPKSHWNCWAPYMRGDRDRSGLWLRVHHTADFEWRKWDTWRLWRPWRAWLDIDTYEQAVRYAEELKEMMEPSNDCPNAVQSPKSEPALKPCPFCGEESPYYLCDDTGEYILCPNCMNELRSQVAIGKDALVKDWNRRAIELETKPLRYDVVEVVAFPDGPITGPSWEGSETWYDAPVVKFSSEDREEAVRFMDGLPIGTRAYIKCIREHQEIVWKKEVLGMDWKRPRLPLHPYREPTFEPLPDGRHVLLELGVEVTVKNGVYSFKPLEEDRRRYDDDPSVR